MNHNQLKLLPLPRLQKEGADTILVTFTPIFNTFQLEAKVFKNIADS
jgi:hypothetical protein